MSTITAIITTVRHGKKNSDGTLTEEGKKQSAERAIDVDHLEGDIILFHSGEQRVRDTISFIGGNIHKMTPEQVENFLDEKYDLQDYEVPSLHFLREKSVKSEYFSKWSADTNPDKASDFLDQKEKFTDARTAFSAIEMARNLSRVILTQIQFASLTKDDCKTNFINGTHEPVIVSFLYYALNDFNPTENSAEFLSRIGGSVHYTEGFDIKVYQHGTEITKIALHFRNIEKEITAQALEDFLRKND